MDLYKNKYRSRSARRLQWDYRSNAAYFVTICTKDREHYSGEVKNNVMFMSDTGKIVQMFWAGIPNHFPFVRLGEYKIMPNHVHGIIIIEKK